MITVTPAFLLTLSLLCLAIFLLKKEYIAISLAIAMCFLPAEIPIKIGPFHFYAIRVIGIIALLKIFIDYKKLNYNTIDYYFILYNILGALIYVAASHNTVQSFIYVSGSIVDSIIIYFVLRHSIQSKETIIRIIKALSLCVLALLPFIIFEFFTAKNIFSFLGREYISIRGGEIRAAGTFNHSILFGSFAAALVPVLWANYINSKSRVHLVSIFCCIFYVYASSSSGPIISLLTSILLLLFHKWNRYSSKVAWLIFLTAIFIHFVRESPIWHFLYVRVSIKASSTGYHRYLLTEAAVKEFWNWWLLGYGDVGPQWHVTYWPWTHATFTDVTNHYLLVGVRGGFFAMLLFIILCFKAIKVLYAHSLHQIDQKDKWLWWGFMSMMITHCVSFLSVAYFGQITMLFFLTLAVAAYALQESKKELPADSR